MDDEDRIIDLGIALGILFMDEDEQLDPATIVPRRAAWHYADSADERRQTEDMLEAFFARHRMIVHGRGPEEPRANDHRRTARLLSATDDVLRTTVKSMITEGWRRDWHKATDRQSFRADPPRAASEIPSSKSDSLSWSIEELREIDRELEAAWKPVVKEAPRPPSQIGATTVAGVTPATIKRHREEGIPYVTVHPARLYAAHPKWPRAESEPLDERLEYYCAQDVTRHMRLWSDACARKGLVQFEVPFDAELYHPRNRDRWPEPLRSSHEEPSEVEIASERRSTGQMASDDGSTPLTNTENGENAVTEEEPTAPPPDWPKPAQDGLDKEWGRLWQAFQYDVNVATSSLLHLLEAIHGKYLAERQRLIRAVQASDGKLKTLEDAMRAVGNVEVVPAYPKLRAHPSLSGEPLLRRTAPDGPMEQIAFKCWVSEVWDLWENRYRNQLKHVFRRLPSAIRPRQKVLGDLRHIRNNLVHGGIARSGQAADCEILRWFTDGEPTRVRLRHVFDFLNQMGWLNERSLIFVRDRGTASSWFIDRTGEPEVPPPRLISARPLVHAEQPDPRYRYEASVVFENGVFGRTPMGPEREESETQAKKRTQKWMKMTVNDRGDLHVPGLGTVSAAGLYRSHLKGEKYPAPGLWQPPVQFRE